MILDVRRGAADSAGSGLPTSNVFYAEDLQQAYEELTARGVQFPLPPVQQPFGW